MTVPAIEIMETPERQTVPVRVAGDRRLVDALRRREPMSAELLTETYGDRAYRLATRITGNAPDAEEVVQDAMWTVVRKIDTFRGESAFGSWFYRIAASMPSRSPNGPRRSTIPPGRPGTAWR
jgi:Sigma-70 region 2